MMRTHRLISGRLYPSEDSEDVHVFDDSFIDHDAGWLIAKSQIMWFRHSARDAYTGYNTIEIRSVELGICPTARPLQPNCSYNT